MWARLACKLIPAETLKACTPTIWQTLGEANSKGALAPDDYPQLQRLQGHCGQAHPAHSPMEPRRQK
jgi:hypothetical protein